MTAVEWLNVICYRNDKIAWEKEEIKKYKLTH